MARNLESKPNRTNVSKHYEDSGLQRSAAAAFCTLLLAVGTSCATEVVGEVSAPLTDATFINVVGVAVNGNSLQKTGPDGWDAGAYTLQQIHGAGSVEFSTGEVSTHKMIGFSNGDTDQSREDIDFAIYLKKGRDFAVYENGAYRGTFGTYAKNDVFRIEIVDGEVNYLHNGVPFYTSAATPVFPLHVDTSLFTNGATINGIVIDRDAFWDNAVGVAESQNSFWKTGADGWDAGAISNYSIENSGHVEFMAGERGKNKVAGLSFGDSDQSPQDIDFGVYMKKGGEIRIWESGVDLGGFGSYVAGDIFKVEAAGETVRYYHNDTLIYTSAFSPSYPLHFDSSLYNTGATIVDVRVQRDAVWTNAVGVTVSGTDIIKTGAAGWNAGATSSQFLTGDGAVEFTASERSTHRMAGLSYGDTDQSPEDIDFAFYLKKGGVIRIRENNVDVGAFGSYVRGDTFRVEVVAGQVRYLHNAVLLHTSANTPTFPLVLDSSLNTPGASIEGVQFF